MRLRSNPLVCRVTIVALLFALNAGAIPALGQQSITSATLSGRIDDASGAAIIGATVAVTNLDKNLSWTVKTDDQGRYYFLYLPVGRYELKVEQPGFAAHGQHLTLSIGQAIDVPIRLVVNAVAEKINVIASGTIVETVRTQVAEAVLPVEIEQLPLNGRNYLDLALLVPGVSRTNTGSNQRFAETSAVPGTGISVGGQRNLNNGFIVDGLSANDDAADLAGTFFSQEVIREFQVITSGAVAEFGRASSGVVNIITKSGTNDWRGSLYGFLRSQKLDARNPLAPRKDPLTQAQYGASIGGPIARDTTFVFANFEQTRRNDSNVITVAPSNVAAINARLDQIDFRGPRIETGLVPGGFDVTNIFARLDHRLDENNLFALRYSFYDISAINSRTVGGLNSVSRGTGVDNRDQTFAVSNVTTLSSRTLNEARFQFTQSRLDAPVNDETGPAVNITGIASFGTATFSPLARDIDLYEIVDNVSTLRGSHSLKAGADFLYNRVNIFFPGALQGVYTFSPSAATAASPAVSALSNFLAGSYSSFQQAFGEASQFQSNPNVGLYLQDEWRPLDRLTINAGLRYDLQFLPDPINTDRDNFAPRLGVAYAPGDRKTVIRASYGLYYDRIPLRATSNALQRDGSKYIVVQMSSSQPGAPVFPNVREV